MTRTARLAVVLGVLNLLVHWATLGWVAVRFPGVFSANPGQMVALAVPHALTLAAAVLVWSDRTPVRLAVVVGNGLLLAGGLFLLDRASGVDFTSRSELLKCASRYLSDCTPGVQIAPVVFLPALVGWWQRRQDRLADEGG